jgi:hypothetical protein
MVHLQLVSRNGENIAMLVRAAIGNGSIKSFEIARVVGGLRIRHKTHLGELHFSKTRAPRAPLLVTLVCHNRTKEWQLLQAFVGRLSYHFKTEIASVNIQFEPED